MKKILFFALLISFFAACTNKSTTESENTANTTKVGNKMVLLAVEGMTCSGCENTVKEAVMQVAGVANAAASFNDSVVKLDIDTTVANMDDISKAITDAGYIVKGVKK